MITIDSIEKANETDPKTASELWSPAISEDAEIEVSKTATLTRQRRNVRRD